MGNFISRETFEIFGDVVRFPEKAIRVGALIAAESRDLGNDPQTQLRDGLVMAQRSDGKWVPYGFNFKTVSGEDVGSGDGSTVTFTLDHPHVVPYSETIYVDGTAQTRGVDYDIDYKTGTISFKAAPATGASITADYLYDDVLDGSEIPVGLLANPVDLIGDSGAAEDTNSTIFIFGFPKESAIKVIHEASMDFAKAYLSKHGFFGITDPECSL